MNIKKTVLKSSGYYGRMRSIGSIITGIILVILGIILTVISGSINALVLSLFGLIAIIYGWVLWKRSKSLIQGKFM